MNKTLLNPTSNHLTNPDECEAGIHLKIPQRSQTTSHDTISSWFAMNKGIKSTDSLEAG